jgi:hypothetical protein
VGHPEEIRAASAIGIDSVMTHVYEVRPRKDKRGVAAPKQLRKKFHVFVKCRSLNALDNTMKTKPIAQDSGWDFSFWFAVSSPFLGVVLGILACAIFCR